MVTTISTVIQNLKHMVSKPSRFIALTVILLIQLGYAATDDEVADRVEKAVTELRQQTVVKRLQEVPPVASKYLEGYTDVERLRGISVWMDRAKGTDRVWMPNFAYDLLINDPDTIKDSSELRRLLASEENPERFFLLSLFSRCFTQRGENFIPEESRMLFRHGRVSQRTNNTTYAHVLGDVGAFTYERIVATLRTLKAPFDEATMVPNGGHGPYPPKIKALVKWLRENWPGCENLGDGEPLMADAVSPQKQPATSISRPEKPFPIDNKLANPQSPVEKRSRLLVLVGCIVVVLVLLVWLRKQAR